MCGKRRRCRPRGAWWKWLALAIKPVRAERGQSDTVDFSDSYDFEYMSILTKEGTGVAEEQTLKGKRVAVIQATVGDNWLTKDLPEAQAVRFPSYDAGIAALKT